MGRHGSALRCQARSSLHAQVRQSPIAVYSPIQLISHAQVRWNYHLYQLLNFTDGRFIRPHLRRKEIESLCKVFAGRGDHAFERWNELSLKVCPPSHLKWGGRAVRLVLALQGDPCILSLLSKMVIYTLESVFAFHLWQSCLQVARSTCFEKSRLLLDRLVDARYHNIWMFSCWQISILVLANISVMQVKCQFVFWLYFSHAGKYLFLCRSLSVPMLGNIYV